MSDTAAADAGPITLAWVRGSEDFSKIGQPIFMRYLIRPLSWVVVVICARLGMTPNIVTGGRIVMTFTGVGLLCVGRPGLLFWVGFGLVLQGVLMTAVDGCLSRVRNHASFFGKFFDGYMDAFTEILMYLALGVYQWQVAEQPSALLCGAVAAVAMSLAQAGRIRHHLAAGNLTRARADGLASAEDGHPELLAWFEGGLGKFLWNLFGSWLPIILWDVRYVGLVVCVALGRLDIWLAIVAVGEGGLLLGFLPLRLLRSYGEIDVHRLSQSATRS